MLVVLAAAALVGLVLWAPVPRDVAVWAGLAGILTRLSLVDRDLFFQDSKVVAARGPQPRSLASGQI